MSGATSELPDNRPATPKRNIWSFGYFGAKDLFTLVNLLGGVVGIYYALQGQPVHGAIAVLIGYVCGDAIDGTIARLTKTANRFGSEFDAASDHLAQAIAPAVIAYVAIAQQGQPTLGFIAMGALIVTASIRQARFAVDSFRYPLIYCGLPRTISGLIAVSLPNAQVADTIGPLAVTTVLVVTALCNLLPLPFMTHKGRPVQRWVWPFVALLFITPLVIGLVSNDLFFDALLCSILIYATLGWIPLRRQEIREFYAEYRRWRTQLSSH